MEKGVRKITGRQAMKILHRSGKIMDLRQELSRWRDAWDYLDTCPHRCAKCSRLDKKEEQRRIRKMNSLRERIAKYEAVQNTAKKI